MPKGNAASTASEMFNGLKSRLGFSREEDSYQDDYDDFEEYDDFDQDGYNAADNREYAGYGSDYKGGDTATSTGGYQPATTRSSRSSGYTSRSSRFGRPDSTPELVTIDDVKARTPLPDTYGRDSYDSTTGTRSTYRASGRELIDNTGPAESSPAYNAAMSNRANRANQTRSEGLDSLFEPTSGSASYDPYEAYSGATTASYKTQRGLTVVRPTSYNDVERVSRALKAGDVVVLAMRATPDDLSKRVLDFSFGVASALDASVECPAAKVFAIARGNGLTESEKRNLISQGVL